MLCYRSIVGWLGSTEQNPQRILLGASLCYDASHPTLDVRVKDDWVVGAARGEYELMNWGLALVALGPFVVLATGIALLSWAGRQPRPALPGGWVALRVVRGLGWIVTGSGTGLLVATTASYLAIPALIVTAVIVAFARYVYGESERRMLMWLLTVAAERNIPLETVARAMAEERDDRHSQRLSQLADFLEAGVNLGTALRRSGLKLSAPAMLAADVGPSIGMLGAALRQVSDSSRGAQSAFNALLRRWLYLGFLFLFQGTVVLFLVVKIVPVWLRMMREFDAQLPWPTEWLGNLTHAVVNNPFLLVLLLSTGVGAMVLGVLCFIGYSLRGIPGLRRIWYRADAALALHWLALAVRHQMPLVPMMRLLASHLPQPKLCTRLLHTTQYIDRGGEWTDGLRRAGLISRDEAALFQSAQRAGNLAWALDELSASRMRRVTLRLQAWTSLLYPLIVLAFGGSVLFVALAVLLPLFSLIDGLA